MYCLFAEPKQFNFQKENISRTLIGTFAPPHSVLEQTISYQSDRKKDNAFEICPLLF